MGIVYRIEGGQPLKGEIRVAGNKNAILPLMAATILTDQPCVITNVPRIRDVEAMGKILIDLGVRVEGLGTQRLELQAKRITKTELDDELVSKLRASVLCIGPLLARKGEVTMRHPGGCLIGRRSVDTHLIAFADLGCQVKVRDGSYTIKRAAWRGKRLFLKEPSVTATENILMLAAGSGRQLAVEDAAAEPHVRNLGEFLQKMGARIQGLGSNRLEIDGQKTLRSAEIAVVPDQIEAGTWAIAAAVTGGTIRLAGICPADLDSILFQLGQFGVKYILQEDSVTILPSKLEAEKSLRVQTRPWPGFPTDLMSPLIVLATQAKGTTLCHDWMYEGRMFFVDKLIQMGAEIVLCDPHRVLVAGPTKLRGKILESPDIRAGMALVIAALTAQGESRIQNAQLVERGYELLEAHLGQLGAKVERIAEG